VQSQARPKIKPAPNVPLILQMETTFGVECHSDFTGTEFRYYATHENVPSTLYLPPEGRDAIVRADPQVGDFIELVKQKSNGGYVYRACRLASDANEDVGPPPPPPRKANGEGVRLLAGNRPAPARAPAPAPAPGYAVQTYAPHDRRVDWNDMPQSVVPRRIGPPQAQQPPPAPAQAPERPEVHPVAERMAACFREAVDAWEQTVKHAKEVHGIELAYTSEDVRATGLTWLINSLKGGGYGNS
jgi:hypothetical protein